MWAALFSLACCDGPLLPGQCQLITTCTCGQCNVECFLSRAGTQHHSNQWVKVSRTVDAGSALNGGGFGAVKFVVPAAAVAASSQPSLTPGLTALEELMAAGSPDYTHLPSPHTTKPGSGPSLMHREVLAWMKDEGAGLSASSSGAVPGSGVPPPLPCWHKHFQPKLCYFLKRIVSLLAHIHLPVPPRHPHTF